MATFLLIPGAGGLASYWRLVVRELEQLGHAAIAVELPSGDPAAGVPEYAQVAIRAAGESDDLVVVGQSMGGFSAPIVAQELSARLIVLVNAMTPTPGESMGDWWEATGSTEAREEMAARDGRDLEADPEMAETMLHDVPDDVVAEMMREEFAQSDAPFVGAWPLPAWPDIPTRFLQGVDDRFFPLEFQRRLARERLGVEIDELPGGHLIALSQPVALAERLHQCWLDLCA